MTSAEALYEQIFNDELGSINPSIIFDLFGYANWNTELNSNKDIFNETINLFLGVYKGLYLMGVTTEEINRCFQENKLDDLIHVKYSITQSGYYREFCEKKIIIGKTYHMLCDEEDIMPYNINELNESELLNEITCSDYFKDEMLSYTKPQLVNILKNILSNENPIPLIYSTIQPPYHLSV